MKPLVAIGMLVLALSLCNLMGRRSANNSNNRNSGSLAESSPAENSNTSESARPPSTIGSSAPPQSAPGVRTLNQNSAASEPPPPPPPTKPTPRAPISGGVLNGKATYLPKPAYPPIAKAAHASGTVNVQVIIDENGNVTDVKIVSSHPPKVFDRATRDAVMNWKCQAKGSKYEAPVDFTFTLDTNESGH